MKNFINISDDNNNSYLNLDNIKGIEIKRPEDGMTKVYFVDGSAKTYRLDDDTVEDLEAFLSKRDVDEILYAIDEVKDIINGNTNIPRRR